MNSSETTRDIIIQNWGEKIEKKIEKKMVLVKFVGKTNTHKKTCLLVGDKFLALLSGVKIV